QAAQHDLLDQPRRESAVLGRLDDFTPGRDLLFLTEPRKRARVRFRWGQKPTRWSAFEPLDDRGSAHQSLRVATREAPSFSAVILEPRVTRVSVKLPLSDGEEGGTHDDERGNPALDDFLALLERRFLGKRERQGHDSDSSGRISVRTLNSVCKIPTR